MIKKIIAFVIIGGALAFAALLMLGKGYNPRSVENETPPLLGNLEPTVSSQPLTLSPSPNITQELAEKIGQEIIARNSQGPTLLGDKSGINTINPEEIINQYLADGIRNFKYEDLKTAVNISDLKIIENSGASLTTNYLNSLQTILKNNFDGLGLDLNHLAISDWESLIKAYDKAITELYNLPVPKNLASVHQKEISLLGAQKKIFQYIQNYKTDPLQAYLAISAAQKINQEFLALKKSI